MCQVREYLEKNWKETSGRDTLALAVRALMEVVEAGSKNLEIALMEAGTGESNKYFQSHRHTHEEWLLNRRHSACAPAPFVVLCWGTCKKM